jgi:zinc transporter
MTKHNHIIFSYAFDEEGKSKKLNNKQTAEELKSDALAWVHLDANDTVTKAWLQKEVSYLDHLIIDALLEEEIRPRTIEFNEGVVVILRGVNLNKNSEPEDMVSIRMWIDAKRIITMQKRDLKAVFDVRDAIDAGKTIKNSSEFLYNILFQILSTTAPFLYGLNDKIDDLEERVVTTHDLKFREEVLQMRSQSGMFKRFLVPQKDAIAKLKSSDCHWINNWSKRHLQENYEHVIRLIEEADEARERSRILHDELGNALTEKLNKNMYKISLVTMIFMPLTFLTGLFGVNLGGIPGANINEAFFIFASLMVVIALLQTRFFQKKGWF